MNWPSNIWFLLWETELLSECTEGLTRVPMLLPQAQVCCNQQWLRLEWAACSSVWGRLSQLLHHWCATAAVMQCLLDDAWMSLRARQPRSNSSLPVCSSTRTHTHRHTHAAFSVCLPIFLSACLSYLSYLLTPWHSHTITQTIPHTLTFPGLSCSDTGSVPTM